MDDRPDFEFGGPTQPAASQAKRSRSTAVIEKLPAAITPT
jgi:hypothetical protein